MLSVSWEHSREQSTLPSQFSKFNLGFLEETIMNNQTVLFGK